MMVATILEPDQRAVIQSLRRHAKDADVFEVRLDAARQPLDFKEIRAATKRPLIVTARRAADGGYWKGEETQRLQLLEAALEAGMDYADLEGPTQLGLPPERTIRSRHDFERTPSADEIVEQAKELAKNGAHAKVACKVESFGDTISVLVAQSRLHAEGVRASIMGLGNFPRALLPLFGAPWVYGGLRHRAEGQPSLRDLRNTLNHWGDPAPAKQRFLVVGDPIAHSVSPRIHNAAFAAQGRDACYGALRVRDEGELETLFAAAPQLGLAGLSVTSPLKEAAYALTEHHTEEASRAKSVNTVRWTDGSPHGHNTDGLGARIVMQKLLPSKERPRALLVGTGGAARGLLASVDHVEWIVAGRNDAALRAIENEFGVGTVGLNVAPHYFDSYDVLVNATKVQRPLVLTGYRGALFDLHYDRRATAWQQHAEREALPVATGRDLVLAQAIPAYAYWTGREAPIQAMRDAVVAPA